MHDGDTILAQAPLRIRAAYGRTVRYRELYRAILDGEIEAERVGRNWVLTKEQLARGPALRSHYAAA